MMKRTMIGLTLVALAAVLVATLWMKFRARPCEIESSFADALDLDGRKTLNEPTRVEAYRLHADQTNLPLDPQDYEIISEAIAVPHDMATEVSDALVTLKTYVGGPKKACVPIYGVRLTFHRGEDRVDVFLCFECGILVVAQNGSLKGGNDFDGIRDDLLRAVKTLFPKDQEIQDLKTHWQKIKSRFW
jgi:hypothetical protein